MRQTILKTSLLLLAVCLLPTAAFADVTLTDQQMFRQRLQAMQSRAQSLARASIPADQDQDRSESILGDPTTGVLLEDLSGLQWLVATNMTYATSSSASGAVSDAVYRGAVQASTALGGVRSQVLDDAFDGYGGLFVTVGAGVRQSYNQNVGTPPLECSNRQFAFPERANNGLMVSRKFYVPSNDTFARWLNVLRNPTGGPLQVVVETSNNLGSDGSTVITDSSSGDQLATIGDDWFTTFRNFDASGISTAPRLGHVLQGPGAPVRLLSLSFNGADKPSWRYSLSVPAGATVIIMNMATGQPTKSGAAIKAIELTGLSANALACMSDAEKGQIVNFAVPGNGAGTFSLATAATAVSEAAGNAVMTINRTGGTSGTAVVSFTTAAGTAAAPGDYTATTSSVNFTDGQTSQTLSVPLVNDLQVEPAETFTVTLTGVTGAGIFVPTLGGPAAGVVSILNDDNPPQVVVPANSSTTLPTANLAGTATADTAITSVTWVNDQGGSGTATGTASWTIANIPLQLGANVITVSATDTGGNVGSASTTVTANTSAPGQFVFTTSAFTVSEGTALATITVGRTGGLTGTAAVTYTTSLGTATPGADYTPTNGTLNFADGELSKAFTVTIFDDATAEPTEFVNLTLTGATGNQLTQPTIGAPGTGVLNILDNDTAATPGVFAFTSTDFSVSETSSPATIGIARTGGSAGSATVSFTTANNSATAGSDYTATTGSVTFLDGELFKTFIIPVLADAVAEPPETAFVSLTGVTGTLPTQPTLGTPSTAILTITDSSANVPGSFAFTAAAFNVTEGTPNVVIGIARSGGSSGTATVSFTTASNTATAGADYTATTGSVFFTDGELFKTISIPIADDTLVESAETFNVSLTGVSGSLGTQPTLGSPSAAVVTINDNDTNTPGAIAFTTSNYTVAEGAGTATINLIRTGGTLGAVSVNYAASDGTANAGTDYAPASGVVNFANGETSKTFTITILDDGVIEPAETLNLTISNATGGASLGAPATALLTISDNDGVIDYFLPEGATGAFFNLDILLANPNPVAAPVLLTFLKPDGTVVTHNLSLPATSRTTVKVDAQSPTEPGITGLENTAVSTVVRSLNGLPLAVEASMFWDVNYYGSHTTSAVDGARTKWYFAEGSQGFFDTFLLLANPGLVAGTATVTYLPESGIPVVKGYALGATSRLTIGAVPELAGQSYSVVVDATVPILAGRSMYLGTPFFNGGGASNGVSATSANWFFAEGATVGTFSTYILLQNPNAAPANVAMTYLRTSGAPIVVNKTIPPNTRITVNTAAESPLLAAAEFSTRVVSSLPIVAERSMFWGGAFPNWIEMHNSFGLTDLGLKWALAEGRVGQSKNFETYILLANPNPVAAEVRIRFLRTGGDTVTKTFVVAPNSRVNVFVNGVPELANEDVGALIESTNGVPIAVERSLYNSSGGVAMAAGTNATGVRIP